MDLASNYFFFEKFYFSFDSEISSETNFGANQAEESGQIMNFHKNVEIRFEGFNQEELELVKRLCNQTLIICPHSGD